MVLFRDEGYLFVILVLHCGVLTDLRAVKRHVVQMGPALSSLQAPCLWVLHGPCVSQFTYIGGLLRSLESLSPSPRTMEYLPLASSPLLSLLHRSPPPLSLYLSLSVLSVAAWSEVLPRLSCLYGVCSSPPSR